MNVGQLREFLKNYPEDIEIVNSRFSDWEIVSEEDFTIVTGVDKGGWVMRSHPTMSKENKAQEISYLLIAGN